MTKNEWIRSVRQAVSPALTQTQVEAVIDAATERLTACLAQGDTFIYPRLGTFTARLAPERLGRNPRTGEPITIAAKHKVIFRPATALSKAMPPVAKAPAVRGKGKTKPKAKK